MRTLRRASAGYLLRHPWQLALALVGIAIGVAVIVAVDLANSSARTAFRLSMDAVTGEATHQVVGGPGGLPDSLYTELRVTHGVDRLAPVVEGYADAGSLTLRVLGVDPFAEREFRDYTLPDDAPAGDGSVLATLLTEPGAMLLSPATAAELGIVSGDPLELSVDGTVRHARLAALLPNDAGAGELRNLLVTDISTAQDWLDMAGRLTRIDVRTADEARTFALRSLLPPGAQLLEAAGRTRAVAEMSNAFMINLTAMSLLALLVGVFLIYNSVSFAVLQRRSLLAMLRALGLTRGQAIGLILGEGVALGVIGAGLGLVAGIWLGEELLNLVARSINDLYFRVTVTDVVLSPVTLAKGIGAGLLATLAASAIPAIEAASYPPRLGMSRVTVEQRAGRLLPRLTVAGLVLAVLTLPVLALSGQALVAGLAALFMAVLGLALCIPWCVRRIVLLAAPLAALAGGSTARFAVAGIGANLSRTGVAIVALAVAVSATVGVSVMVDSFRAAVSDWLDDTLRSDVYVSPVRGSFGPGLVRELTGIEGIRDFSTNRRAWLEDANGRTRLVVLDMAAESYAGTELIDADPADVWPAFEEQGAVLVSEAYGFRNGVQVGDSVRLNTDRGERAFPVAATYRSYDANPDTVIMSRTIYDLFWDDDQVDGLGLYLDEDADPQAVADALRAAAAGRQSIDVRSNAELRSLSLEIFDRTFVITDVLYWLAVGVAIVGTLAAMLALQMERARELATLRALGITRVQLGGMVALQSGTIGILAGLAAVPLGLLMAVMLIDVINRRAFGWSMSVTVAADVLWFALLLAAGSALLAGIYPAWRAGRSRPALAMRED